MSRSQFFFKCLNSTKPLTCTLANEYPSSNEISKKNGTVRGNCIACNALSSLVPRTTGSSVIYNLRNEVIFKLSVLILNGIAFFCILLLGIGTTFQLKFVMQTV